LPPQTPQRSTNNFAPLLDIPHAEPYDNDDDTLVTVLVMLVHLLASVFDPPHTKQRSKNNGAPDAVWPHRAPY